MRDEELDDEDFMPPRPMRPEDRDDYFDMTLYELIAPLKTLNGIIKKGVVRNEVGWQQVWPGLKNGECKKRTDFFVARPIRLTICDIDVGDVVSVHPSILSGETSRKEAQVRINNIRENGEIEVLYGPYQEFATIRVDNITKLVKKWEGKTPYQKKEGSRYR
jgi:hypothetical protein